MLNAQQARESGVEIELLESSGPVSPRYFYELRILLEANLQRIRLTYNHSQKPPELVAELTGRRFQSLWARLGKLGAFELENLVTQQTRERVGISLNRLSLRVGQQKPAGFEYTLNGLEEHEAHRKVVEAIKALAKPPRKPPEPEAPTAGRA